MINMKYSRCVICRFVFISRGICFIISEEEFPTHANVGCTRAIVWDSVYQWNTFTTLRSKLYSIYVRLRGSSVSLNFSNLHIVSANTLLAKRVVPLNLAIIILFILFLHLTRLFKAHKILQTFFANWKKFEFQRCINQHGSIFHIEWRYWSIKSEILKAIFKGKHVKTIMIRFIIK